MVSAIEGALLAGGAVLVSETVGFTDLTPIGRGGGQGPGVPGTLPPGLGIPPGLLALLQSDRGGLSPDILRELFGLRTQLKGLSGRVRGLESDLTGLSEDVSGINEGLNAVPWQLLTQGRDGFNLTDGNGSNQPGGTPRPSGSGPTPVPTGEGVRLQSFANAKPGIQMGDAVAIAGESGQAIGQGAGGFLDFIERGGAGIGLLLTGRTTDSATGETLSFDPFNLGPDKGALYQGPDPLNLGPDKGPLFGGFSLKFDATEARASALDAIPGKSGTRLRTNVGAYTDPARGRGRLDTGGSNGKSKTTKQKRREKMGAGATAGGLLRS